MDHPNDPSGQGEVVPDVCVDHARRGIHVALTVAEGRIEHEHVRARLGLALALLFAGCSSAKTRAPIDAGAMDASQLDASLLDASPDGSPGADAAGQDAAPHDAALSDGPAQDAEGSDAQPVGVYQDHHDKERTGVYVDPAFTPQAAAAIHLDPTFTATYAGPTYAQALYFGGAAGGRDLAIVATAQNEVIAFDAASGRRAWSRTVGIPVPKGELPCGNIDPTGITGTPIIDVASRTLFFDAMTKSATAAVHRHRIFALSVDDGSVRPGWPVDVSRLSSRTIAFNSDTQNQRGAPALLQGTLYVPYGGLAGDCGLYYGWVVGVPIDNPAAASAWRTRGIGAGMWAPAGITSDGTSIYSTTGNAIGFARDTYLDQETILRFGPGPSFSGQTSDYFAPVNWQYLGSHDLDLCGSAPIVFDLPGAHPRPLLLALGKSGVAYLVDRSNLGGINAPVAEAQASAGELLTSGAVYTTSRDATIVYQAPCPSGAPGNLVALRASMSSSVSMRLAWCAEIGVLGRSGIAGAPIVTTTDAAGTNAMVWIVSAEGDNRLRAFDGATGRVLFAGGTAQDLVSSVQHFQAPIVVGERLLIAGNSRLWAFSLH
jgi:outer membrane protein assembly factor BamB